MTATDAISIDGGSTATSERANGRTTLTANKRAKPGAGPCANRGR
jgi:hypothetical protein